MNEELELIAYQHSLEDNVDIGVFKELLEICNNDPDFLREILVDYKESGKRDLEVISSCDHHDASRIAAHAWKGRAAQIGLEATARIAGQVLRKETENGKDCAQLKECFEKDCELISHLLVCLDGIN